MVGLVPSSHAAPSSSPAVGSRVKGRVLDVVGHQGLVELSLKPEMVAAAKDADAAKAAAKKLKVRPCARAYVRWHQVTPSGRALRFPTPAATPPARPSMCAYGSPVSRFLLYPPIQSLNSSTVRYLSFLLPSVLFSKTPSTLATTHEPLSPPAPTTERCDPSILTPQSAPEFSAPR